MYKLIKRTVLFFSKYTGLFRVARRITKEGLRIICYHNFSKGDATEWKPKLFIHPDTFEKRLNYLENSGYQVVPLTLAVERLSHRQLPDLSVVITIDDGWQRTLQYADPVLKAKKYPYTVYASTYYSKKETPVFNLVLQYIFWKTTIKVDPSQLKRLGIGCSGKDRTDDLVRKIQNHAESKLDNTSRCKLLSDLGDLLNIDFSVIDRSKRFHLLTPEEIKAMDFTGVDFQLHSHRHRWPLDEQHALKEVQDNRSFLKKLVSKQKQLDHFCYPSGFYKTSQFNFLEKAEIRSAVTCETGFNYPDTHPYRLYRFLDGENISQLEFEAEMSGFLELLRNIRQWAKR